MAAMTPLDWVELEVHDNWGSLSLRERQSGKHVKLNSRSVKCMFPDGTYDILHVRKKNIVQHVSDHGKGYSVTSTLQVLEHWVHGVLIELPWRGLRVQRQNLSEVE